MDYAIIGFLAGLVIGIIPMIFGAMRGKIGLAFGGFIACVISGALLGLLLAVPVAGIFVYLIAKQTNNKTVV
ncbi:MAG: hypothetical protein H6Q74_707 [Firmicutes bacterium]|nr:hypothetical protein [Bacillota bacterium]